MIKFRYAGEYGYKLPATYLKLVKKTVQVITGYELDQEKLDHLKQKLTTEYYYTIIQYPQITVEVFDNIFKQYLEDNKDTYYDEVRETVTEGVETYKYIAKNDLINAEYDRQYNLYVLGAPEITANEDTSEEGFQEFFNTYIQNNLSTLYKLDETNNPIPIYETEEYEELVETDYEDVIISNEYDNFEDFKDDIINQRIKIVDMKIYHLTAEELQEIEIQKSIEDEKLRVANLRTQRETECFTIINRGQIWYDTLTVSQKAELKEWYIAWLNVTETNIIPVKPKWLY